MIDYKIKPELQGCYVCLFDSTARERDPFTIEPLLDFISGCRWQLVNGEKVRRIPFFISNIPSECNRMIAQTNYDMSENRKASRAQADKDSNSLFAEAVVRSVAITEAEKNC